MGSLKLTTASSGSVILSPANTASDVTITVPAVTGTMLTTASTFAGTGPAFSAYSSSGTVCASSASNKILFDSEEFDTNNNFSVVNSRFTPTVAGYYQLDASVYIGVASRGAEVALQFYKNGVNYKTPIDTTAFFSVCHGSCLVYMNGSTDYVEVYLYTQTGATTNFGQQYQWFQGTLVRAA